MSNGASRERPEHHQKYGELQAFSRILQGLQGQPNDDQHANLKWSCTKIQMPAYGVTSKRASHGFFSSVSGTN